MNAPARAIIPATRRGACPALSAPMATGDGLLVRLNLTEGGLAPATLAALCESVQHHGNGLVEVTARGSFQVRGLTPASAPLFADAVNGLAIPVREGVPVETSPLAGMDPDEKTDPLPVVRRIREDIVAAGLSMRLGPKVSVVVNGGGQVSLEDVVADVRLTAISQAKWLLALAGTPVGEIDGDDEAGAAVLALLAEIAKLGPAARGRDVGSAAAFAAMQSVLRPLAKPSVLQDISPASGEIRSFDVRDWPISPPAGAMSGRTEGRAKERTHLGLLPLRNSLSALAIALPFGQCDAASLASLSGAAHGITDFRFAPGRRLLALGAQDACLALQERAADLGFVTDPFEPRLSIAACAGAPACASGYLPARSVGAEVAALTPRAFFGTIHVSGCAKGCAHPAPAELALVGTDAGVSLVRRGRAGDVAASTHADIGSALAALAAELQKTAA